MGLQLEFFYPFPMGLYGSILQRVDGLAEFFFLLWRLGFEFIE